MNIDIIRRFKGNSRVPVSIPAHFEMNASHITVDIFVCIWSFQVIYFYFSDIPLWEEVKLFNSPRAIRINVITFYKIFIEYTTRFHV